MRLTPPSLSTWTRGKRRRPSRTRRTRRRDLFARCRCGSRGGAAPDGGRDSVWMPMPSSSTWSRSRRSRLSPRFWRNRRLGSGSAATPVSAPSWLRVLGVDARAQRIGRSRQERRPQAPAGEDHAGRTRAEIAVRVERTQIPTTSLSTNTTRSPNFGAVRRANLVPSVSPVSTSAVRSGGHRCIEQMAHAVPAGSGSRAGRVRQGWARSGLVSAAPVSHLRFGTCLRLSDRRLVKVLRLGQHSHPLAGKRITTEIESLMFVRDSMNATNAVVQDMSVGKTERADGIRKGTQRTPDTVIFKWIAAEIELDQGRSVAFR